MQIRNKRFNFIFLLIAFVLSLNFVSAVKPAQSSDFTDGLTIAFPTTENIKQFTDAQFNFHVYNTSNGRPMNNTQVSCLLHLYYGLDDHLDITNIYTFEKPNEWEFNISKGNFTQIGVYSAIFQCNNSISGGFVEFPFEVTSLGRTLDLPTVTTYIFFLLVCLTVIFLSGRLAVNNNFEKDILDGQRMYEQHKRNEAVFYLQLLKRKMWIVGIFGVYLTTLIFMAILSNMVLYLSMVDVWTIFNNIYQVMLWGLIPFVVFWFIYIIIFLYKSVENALRYQFGTGRYKTS